jgi:hypothetical protein
VLAEQPAACTSARQAFEFRCDTGGRRELVDDRHHRHELIGAQRSAAWRIANSVSMSPSVRRARPMQQAAMDSLQHWAAAGTAERSATRSGTRVCMQALYACSTGRSTHNARRNARRARALDLMAGYGRCVEYTAVFPVVSKVSTS